MPVVMLHQRKLGSKQLKIQLLKEFNFLKDIFSAVPTPLNTRDNDEADYEFVNKKQHETDKNLPKRARSIAELEEKLEKIKSQNKFNLKNKLAKKSLSSKLNKKNKKKEKVNKTKMKGELKEQISKDHNKDISTLTSNEKTEYAKPVFNNESKLVFSKFDFSNVGQKEKTQVKDPKKILNYLQHQDQKLKELEQTGGGKKVNEIKEKIAWKNVLQKAEGQKVKDDPNLLKKSIKKMEQKKKQSTKKWESRIKVVEQEKDDRQKKRKENIAKKKKEKKAKVIKASIKRGRVVM